MRSRCSRAGAGRSRKWSRWRAASASRSPTARASSSRRSPVPTDRHQGVVARVAAGEYFELDALLEIPRERGETPFLLALDQVQDPRNFGAILRTAEAFGAHGVIVGKHHQVGLTGAAARVAMGAVDYLPVARATNVVSALEMVKKSGVWIYGSTISSGVSLWAADLTGPLCLVLGSEGEGLRPLVAQRPGEIRGPK